MNCFYFFCLFLLSVVQARRPSQIWYDCAYDNMKSVYKQLTKLGYDQLEKRARLVLHTVNCYNLEEKAKRDAAQLMPHLDLEATPTSLSLSNLTWKGVLLSTPEYQYKGNPPQSAFPQPPVAEPSKTEVGRCNSPRCAR